MSDYSLAQLFTWVICVLAVYRVAHLATLEDGPARIFAKIRESVINKWGFDSWQAEGARCLLCQSVWYAFIATVLVYPQSNWLGIGYWLSIAGAVLIVHRIIYK